MVLAKVNLAQLSLSKLTDWSGKAIFWRKGGEEAGWRFGWLEWSFLSLVLLALGMRLWELDGRAMHYDEAIHLHYAWRLSNLETFIHSPWMHGPFQIELTALIFRIFGDTDFTARLGYVLFGSALVGLPYFLRDYLGRGGALITGIMLMLSPAMLYFSRFGRNDIIMAFWATALFILMWRYIDRAENRYLYMASAVLAFMFATKETAYIVTLIFGGMMFLLALPDLVPWAFGRVKFSQLSGPAGFLLLLVTLTLPQWSALTGLFQGVLGLTLVNPDGVTSGIVGAPQWTEPFLILPLYHASWWVHGLAIALSLGSLLAFSLKNGLNGTALLQRVIIPVAAAVATSLVVFSPISQVLRLTEASHLVDLPIAGAVILSALALLVRRPLPWRQATLLVLIPVLLVLIYAVLFTPVISVAGFVQALLPDGIQVDTSANGIPLNFLVAGAILAFTFLASIYLGVSWRGGVWVGCAAIFYLTWLTLYTSVFTNWAGFFSGIWQGMGYWVAQQEVARGNQPWYYYFVGLSVYELLPFILGTVGSIYYLKKGDVFGLALAFWAGLTLLAYTLASEKMPWLLVNVSLPFILLAGRYLGDLVQRVPWRQVVHQGQLFLLVLPPIGITGGVYFLLRYANLETPLSGLQWAVLPGIALVALVTAYLVRSAPPRSGAALVGLGAAGLLLALGTWAAFRATYTYDDSNKEILVYAQGSADIPVTFRRLDRQVFEPTAGGPQVQVDYDIWYPLQWYVRHWQEEGTLQFSCFKDEAEDGWNASCSPVLDPPQARALLLNTPHGIRDAAALVEYQREGPLRNLLWFPESYRRPGENRPAEGPLEELAEDFRFFKEAATTRRNWGEALNYVIFRSLERDWYNSEYYSYLP